MKTEEQVYNEVIAYINGTNHNRPCTLSTIKKVLRSQRIIDLIFSRPDIFKLEVEFKHVPLENLTEDILIKYVLASPWNFYDIDESLQTPLVMLAFEFTKRRYEYISSIHWGPSRERIPYKGKIVNYVDSISTLCDSLKVKYNDEDILRDYLFFIEKVFNEIKKHEDLNNKKIEKREKCVSKYSLVDFDTLDKVYILISGFPDSGKTTFANLLANRINDSMCFDSDMLLTSGMLNLSLKEIVKDKAKVIVFSDIYADRFFGENEFDSKNIVNILIEPSSIEKMYRNSKHLCHIPFDQYQKNEINSINFNRLENPIKVTNDYDDKIMVEVDKALEEIAKRLNVKLLFELNDCEVTTLESSEVLSRNKK